MGSISPLLPFVQTAIILSGLSLISSSILVGRQIKSWYLHHKLYPSWWERPSMSQKVGHGSILNKGYDIGHKIKQQVTTQEQEHCFKSVYRHSTQLAGPSLMSVQRLCHHIFIAHSWLVSAKHRENRYSGGTTATEAPKPFIWFLLILLPLASCSL